MKHIRRPALCRALAVLGAAGVLPGCGGSEHEPGHAAGAHSSPTLTPSNAGGFYASWRPLADGVPLNEEFDAEVWLFEDREGEQPMADADVSIDCRMPAHRHGMLQDVDLVPEGQGRYLAPGMLCHMTGRWVVHIDVRRGAVTERAQFDIVLE